MTASQNSNDKPQLSLPLFQGLLPFDKVCIGPDIMAGITLAGYAKIIGTPVITGLYSCATGSALHFCASTLANFPPLSSAVA
jgi:hypothetical protein